MKSSDDAPARAWQLEFLNSERESVIVWVKNQETVENVLLDALGLVARRNQRTRVTDDDVTFFNAAGLREFDTVRLDSVDDGPPFPIDVDGAEGLDVAGGTRTKINFIILRVNAINRFDGIDECIFENRLDGVIVLVKGLLDFYKRIFRVFQAPSFSGISRAVGNFGIVFWRSTVRRRRMEIGLWRTMHSDHHHRS